MRINGGGSIRPTRIRYATTKEAIANFLQWGISYAIRESSYVLSVMQLMLLMMVPNN